MMWWLSLALAMDVDDVRARATDHAIAVAQAQAAVDMADGTFWQARSAALPNVELFAQVSTGAGLTSFGFERPVASQGAVGATASWTLIAPGAWASGTAARHSLRGQQAMLDWARVTARRDATLRVAELWAATEVADALEDSADDARRAAEGVDSLVQSGLRPPADGARSEATALTLAAQAVQARGEADAACARVHALLREPVDQACELIPPTAVVLQTGPDVHPAVVAAEQALRAAQASRAGALYDRLPTLSATGTAGEYVAGNANGFGWSAGAEVRMPIVSGGAGLGANEVAVAQRTAAELAVEDQQLQLEAARVAAEARFAAAEESLVALQAADAASEAALTLVAARYREGLESLEAWLGARRERDAARVALAQGRAERLIALAEVESVRGVW